jgi:ankyrin repeat protein
MLRHCLAPSLRDQLNALPKSLDATYERVLNEIYSTNQGRHAHRLLQCLTVAMRPLRVEELAEVLAFELDTTEGELPKYHPDWRWEDQEHAVLSACSSLVTIVNSNHSRVIQFSHFSVKEYLTSERLSTASVDVSRYHIALEPAHLILARACLGVLLSADTVKKEDYASSDECGSEDSDEAMPLRKYAAEHWTSHAQVGNVSSRLKDSMETLFDPNKPYFWEWIQIQHGYYDYNRFKHSQLYFAALYGFYELVQHLINKHPEQVYSHDETWLSPLVGALAKKHIRVAELLLKHGAHVHVQGDPPLCHVIGHSNSDEARFHAVQLLLKHGAHVNAGDKRLMTPLHFAALVGCLEVARILLEHNADAGLRNGEGQVPLHLVSGGSWDHKEWDHKEEGKRLILARILLAGHCTDVNTQDKCGTTPLHKASHYRRPKVVQLLLDHGADAHAEDVQGRNPLHELSQGPGPSESAVSRASGSGLSGVELQNVVSVAQLLLGNGVDMNVLDNLHETPLHLASSNGALEIAQVLLDNGANSNAKNVYGQTPLHLVSQRSDFQSENADVTRLFLGLGMNVDIRDKNQATPLHLASLHGCHDISLALLDHGADINAEDANGQTPLHRVSLDITHYQGDMYHHLAEAMLERGADVNAQDKDQATPLHSAVYMSRLGTARALIDHGANIHAENIQGQTPLHLVSQGVPRQWIVRCESDVVQLLLSRGADVNARDKDQATPLLSASFHLRSKVAKELLQNGADVSAVDIHGRNALHLISQNPNPDKGDYEGSLGISLLERGVNMNGRDNEDRTPLHFACYHGQIDVAEALLDCGAQANAADIQGHTPLHQVLLGIGNYGYKSSGMSQLSLERHPDRVLCLAPLLLEHGADINAQNKDRETPLHLASRLWLRYMARFLLKHGADVNVKNSEGKSPLQVATGREGMEMRRLFSEYSAMQV